MVRKSKLVNTGENDEAVVGPEALEGLNAIAETMAAPENEANEANEATVTQQSETEEDLDNIDEQEEARQLKREKNALLKDVDKIGAAYGQGKVSMISLAERVTEAAMAPAIGVKDAEMIYDRFKKTADAKATLDDNALPVPDASTSEKPAQVDDDKSRAQQLSKLRSFIKLGNAYQDDGVDIVRRARNVHLRMLQGDRKAVKPGSTYTILVAVASEQCKKERKGIPMSDTDIEDMLSIEPQIKEAATAAKKVLDALVAAEAARKGGAERGPVQLPSLDTAIQALRDTLAQVDGGNKLLADHEAKGKKKEAEAAEAAAA